MTSFPLAENIRRQEPLANNTASAWTSACIFGTTIAGTITVAQAGELLGYLSWKIFCIAGSLSGLTRYAVILWASPNSALDSSIAECSVETDKYSCKLVLDRARDEFAGFEI
ncbi:putative endoribonuclease L-PSP family protein [Rosellinia necatrix]|uniref:Putative endoribonuclease L-PSP family protein n=1 Tax=Rosellinia necatrix TaxID=77044 RepID=A0A1W2TCM9_ROSNE|nr:putative endoribonuclease L-PSP family protein [Rosellinia necatrix]